MIGYVICEKRSLIYYTKTRKQKNLCWKHEICDCVKGSNRGQIVTGVIVVILVVWLVILVKDHPAKISMVSQLWLQQVTSEIISRNILVPVVSSSGFRSWF